MSESVDDLFYELDEDSDDEELSDFVVLYNASDSNENDSKCAKVGLAQNGNSGAKGRATGDEPMETQETEDAKAVYCRRLREDVLRICAVLPRIYCGTVYRALLKNADAENRVELTMWDLLPYKRPKVQLPAKRKYADANSSDTADSKTSSMTVLSVSKEVVSEGDKAGTSHPQKPGFVLQPAKLKINAGMPRAIPLPSPTPIIRPAKLTNIHAIGQNDTKASRLLDSDMDGLALTPINKYMKYLELMKGVKEHNLSKPNMPDTTKDGVKSFVRLGKPSSGNVEQGAGDASTKDIDGEEFFARLAKLRKNTRSKGKQKVNETVIEPSVDEASGKSDPLPSTVNSTQSKPERSTSAFTPRPSTSKQDEPIRNDESADFELARSLQEGEQMAALFWQTPNNGDQNSLETCTLLSKMFPDIEMTYITKLYEDSFYGNTEYATEGERTQALVDELLTHTAILADPKGSENDSDDPECEVILDQREYEINRQYSYLITVFPKADPSYMKEQARKFYKDLEALEDFIEKQLAKPTYPTRDQYVEKKRIAKQQKLYTSFDVQEFLEMFPEPFRYFEDPNRKCKSSEEALAFLAYQFSYPDLTMDYIKYIYASKGNNLSLAFNALKKRYGSTRVNATKVWEPTKDIPLLQEIAFLVHKKEIEAHYVELNEREKKLFRELKMHNRLVECGCCYNSECIPSKCSRCDKGHIFCNPCIQKGTEVSLGEGQARIACFGECDGEFSLAVMQRVLRPEKFSILVKKRQEQEVNAAGLEGLVSCPFCSFASIPPPEDKVFKCLNPECMKETCRNCKELNHLPQRCYEERTERARLFLEEKMTEAYVRKCCKCQRPYIKSEGCNKITCPCGTTSCYICDRDITDYNHFAGQGGDTGSNKCPLFSDDARLNNQVVRTVAEKTVDYLKQKDPAIELNAADLLPNVPKPSYGAHEYVPNQDAFLKHRLKQVVTFEETQ